MATTLGDANYALTGLAHTAPPPRQARWIDLRWKEWEPFALMAARRLSSMPENALYQFRILHRERMVRLLTAGLRMQIIKKHRLDDPTQPTERFEFEMAAAIERSRVRPNTHSLGTTHPPRRTR